MHWYRLICSFCYEQCWVNISYLFPLIIFIGYVFILLFLKKDIEKDVLQKLGQDGYIEKHS